MKHVRRSRPDAATPGIRSRSLSSTRRRSDVSRQVEKDSVQGIIGATTYISPPYDIARICQVFEQSNMLRQCVEAYRTNVALYGFEVVPIREGVEMNPNEQEELMSFIASPNSEESLTTIHASVVFDYERLGFAYVEVIRDRLRRVSLLRTVKSSTIRVCPKNQEEVEVSYTIKRGAREARIVEKRKFRTYVQQVNGKSVHFKEMNDPRKLDYETGRFATPEYPVPPDKEATELLCFRQESEDVYGVPRWINQLPNVLGSREAEEVNLRYFEDNTVPPMILTVAGGRLTGESFRELKSLLNAEGVGRERQNKIMLLEAVPEKESLDDKGTVSLKVDKLTDARPSDGLFKDYDEANQAKVRSSFRLPPVSVGLSQDVTFATANVAAFIVETQVYAPLRALFDEVYNKRLINHVSGMNLKTVALRSRSPAITNPETLVKSLTALNVMGAVTPRIAREVGNKILQIDIPLCPEKGSEGYEEWMDKPIIFAAKGDSGNTGIDPAGAGNTHDTQAVKDDATLELEATGDVSQSSPENGQQ